MLIGAMVLAGLVLMVVVADRGTAHLWGDRTTHAFYYCPSCDLRYPRGELLDTPARTCPRHHLVTPAPSAFPLGTVVICGCLGFIGLGTVLVSTGVVPTP